MGNSDHGTTYMRVGGDDGELRPWHYIYVYSIESRLIRRVIYESKSRLAPGGQRGRGAEGAGQRGDPIRRWTFDLYRRS